MQKFVLNIKEASAFLSISQSTLLRLTKAKKLNKVNLSSKRVGWKRDELIRYANKCSN